jgi:SpoVK/Ycf46/Vps4 family AAA+-type ATPase
VGRKLVASQGVTVLFAGPPGTGKTMAAEVIAAELGLDLYKIDLSTVVSKYIGETEKNLERIFSEAASSNAILFFDEADALFGKRSEVRDSHDRYANIEISYLLQRMEAYDGVTILATNLRANLDEAFTRRMQFSVDFPFPDEADRLRIWQTLFPPGVPRDHDLDLPLLAQRYKLAGGNIRNILVSAAYLAAADGGQVTMSHLLHGTRRELQKMGRLLADEEPPSG